MSRILLFWLGFPLKKEPTSTGHVEDVAFSEFWMPKVRMQWQKTEAIREFVESVERKDAKSAIQTDLRISRTTSFCRQQDLEAIFPEMCF